MFSATLAHTPYKNVIQYDTAQPLNQQETTHIQQIVGCLLYYVCALDNNFRVVLNTIRQTLAKPATTTNKLCDHLLKYCATKPNEELHYYTSDMIIKIHSEASFLVIPPRKCSKCEVHIFT